MTNKPEVLTLRRVEEEWGDDVEIECVRLSDYEALQKKFEKLQADYDEEVFCVRRARDSHFGELMRAIERIDTLQAERQILESELATVKKVAHGNVDLFDECEKLRNILSRVAEAVGGYVDPSCSLEFMEEIPKEVELVVQRLVQDLVESRANDRQAMYYLNQVREIVGGDDFPDMVERCRELSRGS